MKTRPAYLAYQDTPLSKLFEGITRRVDTFTLPDDLGQKNNLLKTFSQFLGLFSEGSIPSKARMIPWIPYLGSNPHTFKFISLWTIKQHNPDASAQLVELAQFLLTMQETYRSRDDLIAFLDLEGVKQAHGSTVEEIINTCFISLRELQEEAFHILRNNALANKKDETPLLTTMRHLAYIERYHRQLSAMPTENAVYLNELQLYKTIFEKELSTLLIQNTGSADEVKTEVPDEQPLARDLLVYEETVRHLQECIDWIEQNTPDAAETLQRCRDEKTRWDSRLAKAQEKMATACDSAPYYKRAEEIFQTIQKEEKNVTQTADDLVGAKSKLNEAQAFQDLITRAKATDKSLIPFTDFETNQFYAAGHFETNDALEKCREAQTGPFAFSRYALYFINPQGSPYETAWASLSRITEQEIQRLEADIQRKQAIVDAQHLRKLQHQVNQALGEVFDTLKNEMLPSLQAMKDLQNHDGNEKNRYWEEHGEFLSLLSHEVRKKIEQLPKEQAETTVIKSFLEAFDQQLGALSKKYIEDTVKKTLHSLRQSRHNDLLARLQNGTDSEAVNLWLNTENNLKPSNEESLSEETLWHRTQTLIIRRNNNNLSNFNEETQRIKERILVFQSSPEWNKFYNTISQMRAYGEEILQKELHKGDNADEARKKTGTEFIAFADTLRDKIHSYIISTAGEPGAYDAFKADFKLTVKTQENNINNHQELWKPVLANILLTLLTIGFAPLIRAIYGCTTGKSPFFFSNTCRQEQTAAALGQIEPLPRLAAPSA